jgi:hypothetical protein
VTGLLNIQPLLEDLESRSLQLREARSRCLTVIDRASTVAVMLRLPSPVDFSATAMRRTTTIQSSSRRPNLSSNRSPIGFPCSSPSRKL